jgi:two-component system chemotaxis response regulator CheY
MRFLVVEDVAIMRKLLVNHLNSFGYNEAMMAGNGLEAIEKLKTYDLDFVITDCLMPEMDGWQLTKYIRASKNFKELPILMVTSCNEVDDVRKAVKLGADDYVVKPFTQAILEEKIKSILKKRGMPAY